MAEVNFKNRQAALLLVEAMGVTAGITRCCKNRVQANFMEVCTWQLIGNFYRKVIESKIICRVHQNRILRSIDYITLY